MKRAAVRTQSCAADGVCFYDLHPKSANFYGEVIQGLRQHSRSIAPKFFYDERGSQLFTAICQTPEYYPTRTEIAILARHAEEITRHLRSGCLLLEPGSGNSQKVRILIEAIHPRAYVPIDISKDFLLWAAKRVASEYPAIEVHAICADYTAPFALPTQLPNAQRVAFFPGSSIGNFTPDEAIIFLANLARLVEPGGGVLIGVDLKKGIGLLNAAYNDAQGVTAAFNLNLLRRINRELDADFDLTKFQHHAFYDTAAGRIEMRIVSNAAQSVTIAGQRFDFKQDEGITTEYSYKYTIAEFQALSLRAGFSPIKAWTDPDELFSVHYLEAT